MPNTRWGGTFDRGVFDGRTNYNNHEIVQFALESDTDVQVFGAAGQLVQSRRMQPGQTLDFSGLPAGIYAVKARDDNGFYNGRIVKQ